MEQHMKWNLDTENLYVQLIATIPESTKALAADAIKTNAEEICKKRDGFEVNKEDFIHGVFRGTPSVVHSRMKISLEILGVDYKHHLSKITDLPQGLDVDKLINDLKKMNNEIGINFNEEAVKKVVYTYKSYFESAAVSIRATTKSETERDLCVRYLEMQRPHEPEPYTLGVNSGLIKDNGHPIHSLYKECQDSFDILGYGLDLDVRIGLSKLWMVFSPQSYDSISKLQHIPSGVKNTLLKLKKHGLKNSTLLGYNFKKNTLNMYTMINEPSITGPAKYQRIISDLGFKLDSDVILKSCQKAHIIYFSFSWDSDIAERMCFGVLAPHKSDVPEEYHPLMSKFMKSAQFDSEIKKYIYSIALTGNDKYFKIENDYNNLMVDYLLRAAKVGE